MIETRKKIKNSLFLLYVFLYTSLIKIHFRFNNNTQFIIIKTSVNNNTFLIKKFYIFLFIIDY